MPRYAIIMWLLCKRRLPTRDRTSKLGDNAIPTKCQLCIEEEESIDHLFFKCKYLKLYGERCRCYVMRIKVYVIGVWR